MKNDAGPIDKILLIKHHRQPSSRILRTTADLARRCGARLTFADALEGGDQIADLFQSTRLHELESLLSPHLAQGVEADYRLLDGGLAAAVEGAGAEFDLVVLADDPRTSEARGLQVKHLLRRSPVPVWIDGGSGQAPRRILAAVDVLTRDPLKRALNLPILERALLLASTFRADLEVLSVWTPPRPPLALAHRLAGTSDSSSRRADKARRRLEEMVEQALEAGPPLARQPRLLVAGGLPLESIELAARASEPDLLVLGCVGRDGIAAWLIGDSAEKLAHQLDCSILAVKPATEATAEKAA